LSIDTVNVERDPAAFGLSMDTLPALEPVLPVATFSSNLEENYYFISMQLTDMSKNATSRNCGFS
jgi:PKD repeat protein